MIKKELEFKNGYNKYHKFMSNIVVSKHDELYWFR